MTAGAVSALAWNGTGNADLPHTAARWLLDAQREDGTFERSWSVSGMTDTTVPAIDELSRPRATGCARAPLARWSARSTCWPMRRRSGGWRSGNIWC
ncbi:hypothetical protein [Streptomyces sp. NRRL F-5135]|uniref:hypothetical protein n=1 Tax=Streptomyces sp. NRRL F-5135 TaxID=1463858 RepID=UPI000A818400|nr:hypothetical protein [Streptomyces sp. NRRL F-5135]